MLRGTPTTYYQSLNRPFKIMGVERQLFFLILGVTSPIAVAGQFSPKTDILAFILFAIGHLIGVLVTRADHQMLAIYRRHIGYKKYYSANPGVNAKVLALVPASVPVYEGKKGLI